MSQPVIQLSKDKNTLAQEVADKVIEELTRVQEEKTEVNWVLTGGTVGIQVLKEISEHKNLDQVNWRNVQFWWGDERFVASDSEDRNAVQAYDALLDKIDIDPNHVYEFPSTDDFKTVEQATQEFNADLKENYPDGQPELDLVLLGVGPDAHVASLFPGKPTLKCDEIKVLGEKDSPKPPPERLTMSMPMLNSASKVWCIVAGEEKSEAVAESLGEEPDEIKYPASAVKGKEETIWFIDQEAASKLNQ